MNRKKQTRHGARAGTVLRTHARLKNKAKYHLLFGILFSMLAFLLLISRSDLSARGPPQYGGPDSLLVAKEEPIMIDLPLYFGPARFSLVSSSDITSLLINDTLLVAGSGFAGETNITLIAESAQGITVRSIPVLVYPFVDRATMRTHNAPLWMRV